MPYCRRSQKKWKRYHIVLSMKALHFSRSCGSVTITIPEKLDRVKGSGNLIDQRVRLSLCPLVDQL